MNDGTLSRSRLDRMHDVLARYVDRAELPGLVTLVSRGGRTDVDAIGTFELSGGPPMRRDTIFRIASMTKPVTAVAAMILIEECRLRLDDPVDDLLPELADRQVLCRIDGPLDDTVPADRPITVRDLLTFRLGFGSVMAPPDSYPIQTAIRELQIGGDGPPRPAESPDPDEWLRRLGTLPLICQPGERWLYNVGSDVLGILIARVTGRSLGSFLAERIFGPLGMNDTGFSVPEDKLDRMPTSYQSDPDTGKPIVFDHPVGGGWSKPPVFESGAGGLVSTADDYLAFCQMMLNRGKYATGRILSRPSVELMTRDHLTSAQKVGTEPFFGDSAGWGFGVAVKTKRDDLASIGQYGWAGGLGTVAQTDPAEDLIAIILTQKMMDSPQPPHHLGDFFTCAYAAIDD